MFKRYFFSTLVLLIFFSQLSAEAMNINVNAMLAVAVNGATPGGTYYNTSLGPSTFDYNATITDLTSGIPATNEYIINGAIYTNCGRDGDCSGNGGMTVNIIPMNITMLNGTESVQVNLSGTIGGVAINGAGQAINPKFNNTGLISTMRWQANMQIFGNVLNSTVGSRKRAGTYTGTFTIQVTIP